MLELVLVFYCCTKVYNAQPCQGGGLGGCAGVAAGMDSVAVLLCTGLQGGVLGGLLFRVLVGLAGLLVHLGGRLGGLDVLQAVL